MCRIDTISDLTENKYMKKWWRDLSVSKKLYVVVGGMAILIALELFTLLFAMHTLSAVRAFVNGEGVWSKSQKNAIQSLYQYTIYQDKFYYQEFNKNLVIPKGDRIARLEMMKKDYDHEVVRKGFIQGGNHPSDIDGMINLIIRFNSNKYIHNAIIAWTDADNLMDEIIATGEDIHNNVQAGKLDHERLRKSLARISDLNIEISKLEDAFSDSLGAGSRWLESVVMTILILTVLTVECTGLFLTYRFGRNLNRSLKELILTTNAVGQGNFSLKAPIHSNDELGQLAHSVNNMIDDLKKNIGERKEAESASQVKSLFLANMSHEIRTPLGVILGFAEVLKDQNLTVGDRTNYLEVIERTGKNLNRIINDILDISKVESGHLEVESVPFSLQELLEEMHVLFQLQAQERENVIEFITAPRTPVVIHTDRLRLQQILVNLISNALRFTHKGKITISLSYSDHVWKFRVSDTGIGLNEEQKSKLFTIFSQADQSTTRKYGGTGLGLVLSKKLAQILGGDVVLEKTILNKGSSFVATIKDSSIPVDPEATAEKILSCGTIEGLRGKSVLVVDDSEDNQILLRLYLTKAGIDVQSATNGSVGVDKALGGDFALVLMDIQMPIMDGYTATKKLRDSGYKKPIVALTANAMKEDRERSIESGCNDYLTKPITNARLLATLAKHIT